MPPKERQAPAPASTVPAQPSAGRKRRPYWRTKKHARVKKPPISTEEPLEDAAAILERVRLSSIECEICCTSDIAADNVTMCESGHIFCKDCARKMAESQIGLRRSALPCMAMEGCGSFFAEAEAREFLPPATFKLWERIRAEEEVKAAGLYGIEHCPFCDYAAVIDNKEEKLFRCFNSECSKVTCRECKREDHIPRSCLENQLALREKSIHEAEEQLSAVLMRRCPQASCNTPIIKEETVKSCNRMTCAVCKKDMCYCCRKDVTTEGYKHFDMESDGSKTGKCPLWEDSMERHKRDLEKAMARLGAVAPVKTLAEQRDEEKRRMLLTQRQQIDEFAMQAAQYQFGDDQPLDIPDEQMYIQEAVHDTIMSEKRRRQEQIREGKTRQQELDFIYRIEALKQREKRLHALGFGNSGGLHDVVLGPPIYLGFDDGKPPAYTPLPAKPPSPASTSRVLPSTSRSTSSPPTVIHKGKPGSSSLPPKPQFSPARSRQRSATPLKVAAGRAPRHSEP